MSDQPVQDQDTADRLRQVREAVREEVAPSFADAVRRQHETDDAQLFPQLKQHLSEVVALHRVQERPFRSRVPVIGPLIAWLRDRWNRISTTWYVRPILEQQVAFNAAVVQVLHDLERYVQVTSTDVVQRTDALFRITEQEAAVLSARCDDLRGAVQALEAAVERLEAARPATGEPAGPADLAGLAAEVERLSSTLRRLAAQQDRELQTENC